MASLELYSNDHAHVVRTKSNLNEMKTRCFDQFLGNSLKHQTMTVTKIKLCSLLSLVSVSYLYRFIKAIFGSATMCMVTGHAKHEQSIRLGQTVIIMLGCVLIIDECSNGWNFNLNCL